MGALYPIGYITVKEYKSPKKEELCFEKQEQEVTFTATLAIPELTKEDGAEKTPLGRGEGGWVVVLSYFNLVCQYNTL